MACWCYGTVSLICCWTPIWLSCHGAWLCRRYWCYRSLIDWYFVRKIHFFGYILEADRFIQPTRYALPSLFRLPTLTYLSVIHTKTNVYVAPHDLHFNGSLERFHGPTTVRYCAVDWSSWWTETKRWHLASLVGDITTVNVMQGSISPIDFRNILLVCEVCTRSTCGV